jgi:hypothetical protein
MDLNEPYHEVHLFKILISAIIATFTALSCSGCGVKLGSGIVLGTTGYLAEVNRAQLVPLDAYTAEERGGLSEHVNLNAWRSK